jgi:hypothetical protein
LKNRIIKDKKKILLNDVPDVERQTLDFERSDGNLDFVLFSVV